MPESKCHDVLKPRRGVILVAPPFKAGFSGTTHVSVPSRQEGDKGDGVKCSKLSSFFSPYRKSASYFLSFRLTAKKETKKRSRLHFILSSTEFFIPRNLLSSA